MALPLFIFFFVNILTLFNIVKVQTDIEAALHQTGSDLSLMAFDLRFGEGVVADFEGTALGKVAGAAGVLLAREKVREYLGDGIENSCVSGGSGGMSFLESNVLLVGDNIDLVVDYRVHPTIPLIGFKEIPVQNRFFAHAWTGYDLTNGLKADDDGEEMVYVTEHGEVYHRDIDCSHLHIRVDSVDLSSIGSLRNRDGGRYTACEYCGGNLGAGNVFITGYGDRYHSRVDGPGLKRRIYTIPISEVGGRPPCSACG